MFVVIAADSSSGPHNYNDMLQKAAVDINSWPLISHYGCDTDDLTGHSAAAPRGSLPLTFSGRTGRLAAAASHFVYSFSSSFFLCFLMSSITAIL